MNIKKQKDISLKLTFTQKNCDICGQPTGDNTSPACQECINTLKEIILERRNIKPNKDDRKETN